MVINNNSTTISIRRAIVIAIFIALAAVFLILILEKTRVINFYTKPEATINNITPTPRPINDVNYTPATQEEEDEAARIKESAKNQLTDTTANTVTKIDVSLSAAGQDEKGGPIVIRSMVSSNSGSCKLTINGSTYSKEYTSNVENTGTYNACKGFDIPIADIPTGSYTATLTVINGTASGSVSQNLEVSK